MTASAANFKNAFDARRVLVTGGMGFVGSNLASALHRLGAKVTVFDCMLPGSGANEFNVADLRGEVQITIGDLRDRAAVERAVDGTEYIFNLAGEISHVRSMRDPFTDHAINCAGQLNLVEAWRQRAPEAKIVYAGTRQQYGRPRYVPMDEEHPLTLSDVNAIHKTAAESYHLLYARVYGMRAVSVRLTNTFGPHMLIRTAEQTFVGWFVHQALTGQTIQIFGDGTQRRDLTYVTDAVEAMLLVASRPEADGEVFNVSGPEPVTLRQVAEATVRIAGRGACTTVPFPDDRKKIDIGDAFTDGTKLFRMLGWRPTTSLEEGLRRTIGFYRSHWDRYA